MADKKISELPYRGPNLTADDLLVLVARDDDGEGNINRMTTNIAVQDIFNNIKSFIAFNDGVDSAGDNKADCSITQTVTHLTGSTAGELTVTLANGSNGQYKVITMTNYQNNAVNLTATFAGATNIAFNAVGDTVSLLYTNQTWIILSSHGVIIS